jgi:hypothetical protein
MLWLVRRDNNNCLGYFSGTWRLVLSKPLTLHLGLCWCPVGDILTRRQKNPSPDAADAAEDPNSWESICQVRPPAPKCQIKRGLVKAEKGGLLHNGGHAMGRCRESISSSSANFGVQTWAIGLSRQKNWGQGTQLCIVKQSQSQVCSGWPLPQSKGSGRVSRVVIWIYCQLAGGPSWGRFTVEGSFCLLPWRYYHLSFLESKVIAKWLQREWRQGCQDSPVFS